MVCVLLLLLLLLLLWPEAGQLHLHTMQTVILSLQALEFQNMLLLLLLLLLLRWWL
jgi:hypothetical protein